MSAVVRDMSDHRSLDGVYCDRCGLPVVKWPFARCMPSHVKVLVHDDEARAVPEMRAPVLFGTRWDEGFR